MIAYFSGGTDDDDDDGAESAFVLLGGIKAAGASEETSVMCCCLSVSVFAFEQGTGVFREQLQSEVVAEYQPGGGIRANRG